MTISRPARRFLLMLCLAALLLSPGCAYLTHRGEDALDMIDIGLTVSKKPGFALYYSFVPIVAIGVSAVDGHFVGIGGGKIGVMPHFQRNYGAILWGQEQVAFGEFDKDDLNLTNFSRHSIIGLIQGPRPGPDYFISCPHYLYLGWIGAVGSPRYLQALDFILGWTTLDILNDDGRPRGYWFWTRREDWTRSVRHSGRWYLGRGPVERALPTPTVRETEPVAPDAAAPEQE